MANAFSSLLLKNLIILIFQNWSIVNPCFFQCFFSALKMGFGCVIKASKGLLRCKCIGRIEKFF